MAENPKTAVVDELIAFLKRELPGIGSTSSEWPEPGQAIVYPALAVITRGDAIFTPQKKREDLSARGDDYEVSPGKPRIATRYVVGRWEIPLQIHLWAVSKIERTKLDMLMVVALNAREGGGLALRLKQSFGEWATITMQKARYNDTEESTQRKEWRVIVDVVADCNALVAKVDPVILTTEVQSETSTTNTY